MDIEVMREFVRGAIKTAAESGGEPISLQPETATGRFSWFDEEHVALLHVLAAEFGSEVNKPRRLDAKTVKLANHPVQPVALYVSKPDSGGLPVFVVAPPDLLDEEGA